MVIGNNNGIVFAITCSTGVLAWAFNTTSAIWVSAAVGADNTVYIGSTDHKVYAVSGSTGTLMWSFTTANAVVSSPSITSDGALLVGSNDKHIYCLSDGGSSGGGGGGMSSGAKAGVAFAGLFVVGIIAAAVFVYRRRISFHMSSRLLGPQSSASLM